MESIEDLLGGGNHEELGNRNGNRSRMFLDDEAMDESEEYFETETETEADPFESEETEENANSRGVKFKFCTEEQTFIIKYKSRTAFVEEHDTSSVGISLITTAAARSKLFDSMARVVDSGYCTLLYTDTDSIIYVCPEDKPNPLKTGDGLGELNDEYPNDKIVEFYSPGPKQYLLVFEK